jgi:aminomethyltransferase
VFASRTGYTGEDGLELVTDAEGGPGLWRALLDAGVTPCGLGARDTLRLEAALLLYGNDMDEETNPFEAGLEWVVTLDDGADFIGRTALERIRTVGVQRTLVCLKAQDRGIMRAHCDIFRSGQRVGTITSGGYSPTLGVSIGMGSVPPSLDAEGTELTVDVRGKELPVRVVPRPFYKRPKKESA